MFISQHFQPTYIADQIKLFLYTFKIDLDLRFPEVRKRKRIESQMETGEAVSLEGIEEIMDVEHSNGIISFFDWPELVAWHECFSEFNLKKLLHKTLNDSSYREKSVNSSLMLLSLKRLTEIDAILSHQMMGRNPSLRKALWNRWNLRILSTEARFLIQFIQKI